MRIEPSVWSAYFIDYNVAECVRAFTACGYTISELSTEHGFQLLEMGNTAKIGAYVRGICDGSGFDFPQGHLWLGANICGEDRRATIDSLKTWLDMYMEIGIPRAILHGGKDPNKSEEENLALRVDALRELTDFIGDADLTICMENVGSTPSIASLQALLDGVNSDHLAICLDTGHLNIYRDAERNLLEDQAAFIRHFGHDKLQALHLHDNDGSYDMHMLPFSRGNIQWEPLVQALRDIDYTGILNWEIPGESHHCPMDARMAKLLYLHTVHELLFGEEE